MRSAWCRQNGQCWMEAADSCPVEEFTECTASGSTVLEPCAVQISMGTLSPCTNEIAWVSVGAIANNTATSTVHHTARGRRSFSVASARVISVQTW